MAETAPQPDRARLRELLADATPTPWASDPAAPCDFGGDLQGSEGEWNEFVGAASDDVDTALIVAAVNALPALLDRLDELEAENERLAVQNVRLMTENERLQGYEAILYPPREETTT